MSFYESQIKDVGTDTKTNSIMSRNRYNSLYPNTLQPKQTGAITNSHIAFNKPLGTFKKGGPVKKTGIYKLHEGEYVMNKKKAMAAKMNDSDSLREYSRTDGDDRKLYRMPEGTYKKNGDRYEKEDKPQRAVIHG